MSGFTALNGSSPKAATKPIADAQNGTKDQPAKAAAPTPVMAVEAAPAPPPAPAPVPASTPVQAPVEVPAPVQAPGAEAPAPTPAAAAAPAPAQTQAPAVQSPNQRESWPTQGLERTPPEQAQGGADSPNKRKRSNSSEGRTQLPTQPAKRTQRAPAPERTQERTPETGTIVVSQQQPNGNHYQNESPTQAHPQEQEKEAWHAQSGPAAPAPAPSQAPAPTPAAQQQAPPPSVPIRAPAEQQQLVQHQSNGQMVEYATPVTPQNTSQAVVQYQSPAYTETRAGVVVQHDPKKRKRNFSNRTKTGCLTCRRRKKKCDEAKPECKHKFSPSICTIDTNPLSQATTVSKAHLFVPDTLPSEVPVGPRLSKTNREEFPSNPKTPTTSHLVLMVCLRRHIPLRKLPITANLAVPSASPCPSTAATIFALNHPRVRMVLLVPT